MSTLDEVAAQLYAAPPEEFTAARTEAVKAARAAGDRDLARELGALRRPTVGAWLVNLLAHRRPDLIGDLLTLGAALRKAQRNLRGDELRELSVQRKAMVGALAREARALAVAAGRGVRDTLPLAEVETTLGAALADDEVADQVRLGRLVRTVEYAGFGEAPRPQLRLLQGGKEATAETRTETRTETHTGTRTGTRADAKAAEKAQKDAERVAKQAAKEAAKEEAAARRAAEEKAAAKAAERERAAEQRRRKQLAHRELLAARTALAEAEVARTAAERAVRDARRRVEAALAAVEAANVEQ